MKTPLRRSKASAARSATILALVALLASAACAVEDASVPTEPVADAAASPADITAEPTPDTTFHLPDDWQEQALAAANSARRAVVAIGWEPPTIVNRRLETGWLLTNELVVTSNVVACDVQRGENLKIKTFDGTIRDASVEEIVNGCGSGARGIALLRLDAPVDAPTLALRTGEPPVVGEPLLAIGHANFATTLGGWLVAVGPVVISDPDVMWADIGMAVDWRRTGEFFGGGANGAPLVDLEGNVAAVLCCERDWAPPIGAAGPIASSRLRTRIVLDAPYFVGGVSAEALRPTLERLVRQTGP